jgi:hypothetical protein
MGLDTSHGCWHGAYGAFSRWREKVAEVAGYAVWKVIYDDRMLSNGTGFGTDTVMIDWGHVTDANLQGEWDETPADPLIVLIAHSDCDGVIKPEQAGPLADRLAELLPLLPDEVGAGHIGHWRTTTQQFIDGLRAAAAAGEEVDFH